VTAGPTATKAAARAQAENRKAIAAAKTPMTLSLTVSRMAA
jgi:hypothetical protein